MDGVANEKDFDQYGDPKMEHDNDDEVPYTTRRSRTTLPKGRPFKRRTPFMNHDVSAVCVCVCVSDKLNYYMKLS